MNWLDIPSYFDPINRIEGVISTFRYADWEGAYQRDGIDGVVSEFWACVTSSNAPTIHVSRYSSWSGIEIERLLGRHGVRVWDRGISGDDMIFCVKRRQVEWAEYLLLRAGVPVKSLLNEPRNLEWTEGYVPGSEPLKRNNQAQSIWDEFLRWLLR
jgi:hypothetical protein